MTEVLPRFAVPDLSDLPPLPPCIDETLPEVFSAMDQAGAFADRDMINMVGLEPRLPEAEIKERFARLFGASAPAREVVERFVNEHFSWPIKKNGGAIQYQGGDFDEHGHAVLLSHMGTAVDGPTTIGAPNQVMESGGRYSDERPGRALWYYWDTETSVVGLDDLGEKELGTGLVDNIRDQVERFRRPPLNGNAPEYRRSQPPIYSRLVRRDAQLHGPEAYEHHLPAMLIEYWSIMDGANDPSKLGLAPGSRYKSVVRMPDGSVLNVFSAKGFTYADGTPRPRPESRRADLATKAAAETRLGRELAVPELSHLYEETHTGAGAGTDFADWMLGDLTNMDTIRVTRRVPPFQNALVFELECTIAEAFRALGYEQEAEHYETAAMLRAAAVNKYLYNEQIGFYLPYDLDTGQVMDPSLQDGTFLLESGIPPSVRAAKVTDFLRQRMLTAGGLVASPRPRSRQSWSGPNVWPLLQRGGAKGAWLAGDFGLEEGIRTGFLNSAHAALRRTGYGKERYNAFQLGEPGVAGEYKAPDHNFSWDTATEVDLRNRGYRNEAERRSWQRRRQIAGGVGRLAMPA
ncbi:MAG TPA: trehalase family glycosidase [Candidatus Pristimantibacillus sp.]|nr:trehalase family glycosidase [Candidatus Pristimantibacillus sp.]